MEKENRFLIYNDDNSKKDLGHVARMRLRWAGHVVRMKKGRSAFKILTGKPTGKRLLGKSTRRWEDNVRKNIRGIVEKLGIIYCFFIILFF